jgi:hypothetical protein
MIPALAAMTDNTLLVALLLKMQTATFFIRKESPKRK